jgi:hypothetical protein
LLSDFKSFDVGAQREDGASVRVTIIFPSGERIASILNQFTGVRTATLEARLKRLEATLERIDSGERASRK